MGCLGCHKVMRWEIVDKYHMESDKDYAVSRAYRDGVVVGYSAWSPKDTHYYGSPFKSSRLLGCVGTSKEAIDLCNADYQALQTKKGTPET